MNWVRFVLACLAVFMGYFTVYMGGGALLGINEILEVYQRAEDDPLMIYALIGHVVMTLVIVGVFFGFVKTKSLKVGAFYGAMIGLYFAAAQLSIMGSMRFFPADLVFTLLPLHVLAGIIAAGIIPTLVYAKLAELPKVD